MPKQLHLDSEFSLTMPNNYIIDSDVDSREVEECKFAAVAAELPLAFIMTCLNFTV